MNRLLTHEQLHFDISELYARKMRKILSEFHPKTLNEAKLQLKRIHHKVERERIYFQNTYDKETQHGTLTKQQQRWQKRVGKALSE
ncbi:DUF922 domain-containing protein [Mesonia aestuariivivens]|uniref:DUF922 domain-containing protein n=1 Tax=Mesonia aestuariivivens TaxID=2796128 RepID=A0ABS6W4Q3_9FLAO|nr:DUF922 domain-containing protein [Mesonia aestuariivivens]